MPIFIAERIEKDALQHLKDNKVTVSLISNIFGNQYAELLNVIVSLFTNASAIISNNPKKLEEFFVEISKAEGRFNNLAGDMFELLAGYYFNEIGCSSLSIKKHIKISDENKSREIDVLAKRDGCLHVVECKATRSMIDDKFADEWLGVKIPQIRKWLLEHMPEPKNHIFELWSVGGFTPAVEELLKERQKNTGKYSIRFYNKKQMREMAEGKAQVFLSLLDQHFK
jgi:Holliday junction resolvase-like predicted endonuclease